MSLTGKVIRLQVLFDFPKSALQRRDPVYEATYFTLCWNNEPKQSVGA